jgi:ribokinase
MLSRETLNGTHFAKDFGGKACNQAVMAAKIGGNVAFIGKVGNDTHGKEAVASMQSFGIDCQAVKVAEQTHTGIATILVVQSTGENMIVPVLGANGQVTPADVEDAMVTLQHSHLLVTTLEFPLPVVEHCLAMHKETAPRGWNIVNAAPFEEMTPKMFLLTDFLILNAQEACALCHDATATSTGPLTQTYLQQLAATIHARGTVHVIITLGAQGAFASWAGPESHPQSILLPAPPLPRGKTVISTVGAGDAFVATFAQLLALSLSQVAHPRQGAALPLSGTTLQWALEGALAGATLSVTQAGAQASYPTRSAFESFYPAAASPPPSS